MVKPVDQIVQKSIPEARFENVGQFNSRQIMVLSGSGRQLSNFVAGTNATNDAWYKAVKVSAVLTAFLPLLALAHGDEVLAGFTFVVGCGAVGLSFMQMYLTS